LAEQNPEFEALAEWAARERDNAVSQIELFGPKGVKAQLVMPDGATQEITQGVLDHQHKNIIAFERLIAALNARP
jgi:hypothetical protein